MRDAEQTAAELTARALDIFTAAVESVHPRQLIEEALVLRGTVLRAHGVDSRNSAIDLNGIGRVVIAGLGKAAAPMAGAVEDLLEDRLEGGIVSVKHGHAGPLNKVRLIEAGHPVPDEGSVRAGHEILALLGSLGADDLALVLITGGGSALLDAWPDGITLDDARETFRILLECGAPIQDVNTVRKHISLVKGGQLARAASPARVLTLVLSDVIGDPLSSIASGPTVPDPTTFADALAVLEHFEVRERVPDVVLNRLTAGERGEIPDTPKDGDEAFRRVETLIIGNLQRAVAAAAERARVHGFTPHILTTTQEGEAAAVGRTLARLLIETGLGAGPVAPPCCLIAGGETTVTLTGGSDEDDGADTTEAAGIPGRGGRNQELALAAAGELAGRRGVVLLSAGTDGTDGPTDAAGGVVDGWTWGRAEAAGLDPADHLRRHDAYPLLKTAGGLIRTGPTMTNVMDIILMVAGTDDFDGSGEAVDTDDSAGPNDSIDPDNADGTGDSPGPDDPPAAAGAGA